MSTPTVDRQTTTPFLLRLFYKNGSFHRPEDFTHTRPSQNLQIYTWQTCTFKELTQLLLTTLPKLQPSFQLLAGTRVAFRLIFQDMQGPQKPGMLPRYISRDLGSVIVGARAVGEGEDVNGGNGRDDRDGPGDGGADVDMEGADTDADKNGTAEEVDITDPLTQLSGEMSKTLYDSKFVIGDYICAGVFPPLADGSVAAAPPPPVGPAARGPPPREPFGGRGGRENGFGGRGDYGYGGGGGGRGGGIRGGGGRFEDRRGGGGGSGFPSGEWRRGEAPPEREEGFPRGGYGGERRGRGRGRF